MELLKRMSRPFARTPSRKWFVALAAFGACIVAVTVILAAYNVPTSVTQEDKIATAMILGLLPGTIPQKADTFEGEIRDVLRVQAAVHALVDHRDGIPHGVTREPMDLFQRRNGLCYDVSRAIEKILTLMGYETRHAFIITRRPSERVMFPLLTPSISSHAISEVLTRKGWMGVGSVEFWIGLDSDGNVFDLGDLQKISGQPPHLDARLEGPIPGILIDPFVYYYGLYARHGKFYPPYNAIPDVNWPDFVSYYFD